MEKLCPECYGMHMGNECSKKERSLSDLTLLMNVIKNIERCAADTNPKAGELKELVIELRRTAYEKVSNSWNELAFCDYFIEHAVRLTQGVLFESQNKSPLLLSAFKAVLDLIKEMRLRKSYCVVGLAGENTKKAWLLLTEKHPEFREIEVDSNIDAHKGPRISRAVVGPEGYDRPRIVSINIGNDDEFYKTSMTTRRESIRLMSKALGIRPEEMTVQLLKVFILAHEFGHADDLNRNYLKTMGVDSGSKASLKARREQMQTLFVPGLSPGALSDLFQKQPLNKLIKKYPQLANMPPERAVQRQDIEYRALPCERVADDFAAAFIRENWEKLGFKTKQEK